MMSVTRRNIPAVEKTNHLSNETNFDLKCVSFEITFDMGPGFKNCELLDFLLSLSLLHLLG